jgi:hypothetical protein
MQVYGIPREQPQTVTTVYKLEFYSERDGLWHSAGLFASHSSASRYANSRDFYSRITGIPLLTYFGRSENNYPNG